MGSVKERIIKLEIKIRGPEECQPVKVLIDPSDTELAALEAAAPGTLFVCCRTIDCSLEVNQ